MVQMMTKFLLGWEMWMSKKFKLVYIQPLLGPKSLGKRDKSANMLVLEVKWDIENWEISWIPYSPTICHYIEKNLEF